MVWKKLRIIGAMMLVLGIVLTIMTATSTITGYTVTKKIIGIEGDIGLGGILLMIIGMTVLLLEEAKDYKNSKGLTNKEMEQIRERVMRENQFTH